MSKLGRSPEKLEPLEMFRRLDQPARGRIDEGARIEAVLTRARTSLQSGLGTASTVHGWRAQGMFESLVVALDGCELLTSIDHGQVFYDGEPVKPADLSLVLRDRRRLLVDIKALPPGAIGEVRMSAKQWRGLRRFGELMGAEVYLAYLVSGARMWTLVPLSLFPEPAGTSTSMRLTHLIEANEMHLLGDLLIALEPPLAMHVIADRSEPRPARLDRAEAQFTIGAVEFAAGGRPLIGKAEKDLAYFMMMFGRWDVSDQVLLDGDRIDRIVFEAAPSQPVPKQPFEIIGSLSSMYSGWFDLATSDQEGNVLALDTDVEPGMLPTLLPRNWHSEELPLWRLDVRPETE